MEILNITKEAATAAYKNANSNGKALIENLFPTTFAKKITDRIKNFSDVLAVLKIDEKQFNYNIDDMSEYDQASAKLQLIVRALNEGWKPDWKNSREYKYVPYFNLSAPGGFSFYYVYFYYSLSIVGSRLCFRSEALAKYAAETFSDVYRDFITL